MTLAPAREYTSNVALAAAPFTEGATLAAIPPAEIISNIGFGIKFGVNLSDGDFNSMLIEGGKKLISTGIGSLGNKLIDNSVILNPAMTKTEKAIHEAVVGGTTTVVSKSVEKVIDKKTEEKK